MENQKVALSIIIPVFNEELSLKELSLKIADVLNRMQEAYEIILVDDGSTDNSFNVLKELSQNNEKLKVIRFRKNFGKSAALTAGFKYAKGNFIITMDADLQDDPEEIPNFLKKIKEGYDLVVGWKAKRMDPLGKRMASKIFNGLTTMLTGVKVHDSNCCFKIFKNELAENIKVHGELHRYIPALAHWQGYRITEIKVSHYPRKYGKSKYGLSRLFKGFLDLITVKFLLSYLTKPIQFFGLIGLLLLLGGFLLGSLALALKFIFGLPLQSSQLPLLTVFFGLTGIQFILMGLLAEILIRIYYEPKAKSPYSIKEEINFS